MPSAVPSAAAAARLLRTHLVFGANTDVGKTVVTAGLARARLLKAATAADAAVASPATHYIKPLQCGGSDEGWVRRHAEITSTATDLTPISSYSAQTLYRWEMASSPHLASCVTRRKGASQ